jgi:hypothetical protein
MTIAHILKFSLVKYKIIDYFFANFRYVGNYRLKTFFKKLIGFSSLWVISVNLIELHIFPRVKVIFFI